MNIRFRLVIQDSMNFIRNHLQSTLILLLLLTVVRVVTHYFSAPYLAQLMHVLSDPTTLTLTATQQAKLTPQIQQSSLTFSLLMLLQFIILIAAALSFIHQNSQQRSASLLQYSLRFLSLLLPIFLYFILITLFFGILLGVISILLPASSFIMVLVGFLVMLFASLGPIIIVSEGYSAIKALWFGFKVARQQLSLLIPLFMLVFAVNMFLGSLMLIMPLNEVSLLSFILQFIYNLLLNTVLLFVLISLYRIYMLHKQ